jgi:hypothetical protein
MYRSGALYGWDEPKLEVDWQSVFARIECLDISVEIGKQHIYPHRVLEKQGAALVNNILHQLQQELAGRKDLRSIRVQVSEYTGLFDPLLQSVLSPLLAIASRFKISRFIFVNISEALRRNIHNATTGLRNLRAINEEVEREVCSENGEEVCKAIALQKSVTVPDRLNVAEAANSIRVYAYDRLLKREIGRYEEGLKMIEDGGGVSDDLKGAVGVALKRLQHNTILEALDEVERY